MTSLATTADRIHQVAAAIAAIAAISTATTGRAAEYPVNIVSTTMREFADGSNILHVSATIEKGFHSYADDWRLSFNGDEYHPRPSTADELPSAAQLEFVIPATKAAPTVSLTFSACSDKACLLPRTIAITPSKALKETPLANPPQAAKFAFASADGYMDASQFAAFLRGEAAIRASIPQNAGGWIMLILTFVAAGFALNFTPCVLPLIPVQLSILGIGANRTSKSSGFKRGFAYGLGMAASYGALGLAIVFTGGFFGTIQSSPWFNISVGILFILLALSMLDIFAIDFSHFGRRARSAASNSAVFLLGAATAILAGTCVAPAVIAALLLSGTLYAAGSPIAFALPFALGVGMGLPWPFVGAGIASMPRPGKWMIWIKTTMAAIVVAIAATYFAKAYRGWSRTPLKPDTIDAAEGIEAISAKINAAATAGKPVLLDFKASWCDSCKAMEDSVLTDNEVTKLLEGFTMLSIQAEDTSNPAVKSVLSAFDIHGLPAFRILK